VVLATRVISACSCGNFRLDGGAVGRELVPFADCTDRSRIRAGCPESGSSHLQRLRHRDAVVGVARCLVQAADFEVMREEIAMPAASSLALVDAQAGRQALPRKSPRRLAKCSGYAANWSDAMLVLII